MQKGNGSMSVFGKSKYMKEAAKKARVERNLKYILYHSSGADCSS